MTCKADDQRGGAAGGGEAALGAEQFRVGRLELRHLPAAAARTIVPLRNTLRTSGSQDSRHSGHLGQPPLCTGVPPSRAGLAASAANTVGPRRALSQARAAEPAAAVWMNPRRVMSFSCLLPSTGSWFRNA